MYRLFISIVLSIFLILPVQAKDSDCGLNEDGTISDYNFDICEEDKSFGMLYALMPDIFNDNIFNYFDAGEVEVLENSPEILYDKQFSRFTPVLKVIFSSVVGLVALFAGFVVSYKTFWSLLNSMQNGSFMVDQNFSIQQLLVVIFITSASLIQINDLVLIQVVILLMAMLGISLANFIFSAFLSTIETKNYADENTDISTKNVLQNHNESISRNYVTSLTKMALCREITAQYIMSRSASLITNEQYAEKKQCAAGIDGIGVSNTVFSDKDLLNNQKDFPSFINHELTAFDYQWDKEIASTQQVNFGLQKPKTCKKDEFIEYECGFLTTVLPTINDNELLKAIGKDKFSNVIWGVIKSLNLKGGNTTLIQNGWENIHAQIDTKLQSYADYEMGTEEYEIAYGIIKQRNNTAIKRVAYYYHQLIQNALTTGIVTANHQLPTDSPFMAGKTGSSFVSDTFTESIETDFQRATSIAKKIQKQHCILNNKGVSKSVNFQKNMTNQGHRFGNVSPLCVDIDSLEVYGVDSNNEPLDNRSSAVLTSVRDIQIDVIKDTMELSKEIAIRRMEVESSLSKVIRILDGKDFLPTIRKQGWLVMPSYISKLSREIRTNEFYFEALVKSGNFAPIKMGTNFVASEIDTLNSTVKFPNYVNHSNVFAKLQNKYSDSVYANSSQYVVSMIENNEEELYKGSQTFKEIYSTLFQSPFPQFKKAIGVYDVLNNEEFSIKNCSENTDLCPIPNSDPIIELNKYGHYLIKNSIAFFSISAGLNAAISTKSLMNNKKEKNAKKNNKNYTKKKNDITSFLGVLDVVNSVLGLVFTLQMALGIYLAYVLPLIPTFYFAMAFLAWLLVVVQALIISPLLMINLLRWEEEKQNIMKYVMVYSIQIVLKPIIVLTVFIISYFIFKALLFFVNTISIDLFSRNNGSGFIESFALDLIAVIAMSYLVFVLLRICFNLINTSTDYIMEKLEAKTGTNDDFSSVEQYLEGYLTMKSAKAVGKGFEKAGKFGQEKQKPS